jgi:ribosomal protein S27AE
MTTPGERPTLARIRELRRAVLMFGLLFVLWWIVEFLYFAGRTELDPFDVTGFAILAAGGWLVLRARQARCPRCGNRFFVNPSLPLGFHFSSECPYCGLSLHELDQVSG